MEGFYSIFFLVDKKGGGVRPILNLKPLNKYIIKRTFKMENLRSIKRAVKPGDWLVSIDLQDAYMHIPIHPDFRKFLRFKIAGKVYQFKVLPFGLASAPRVFTKLMAPVVALARTEGLFVFPYLDDWIMRYQIRRILPVMLGRLLEILILFGLLKNDIKSHLTPSQSLEFVGGHFLTNLNLVRLPKDRVESFIEVLQLFKLGKFVTARSFLVLLGKMAAMIEVVKHCRLYMRPVQLYLMAHWSMAERNLTRLIPIKETLVQHLSWWQNTENLLTGVPLEPQLPEVTITTDASSTLGWGGHLEDLQVQGTWSPAMKSRHINELELEAVVRTCHHFVDTIKDKSVLIRSDNATVVAYLNKEGGTKSPSLCMQTWRFLKWTISHNIVLSAEHVPGTENEQADKLSRVFASPLEWKLNPGIVQTIFLKMGRPLIDLFASAANNQLQVYCSRLQDPQAYQTDALRMNWDNTFGYAFPPISLIHLVLDRIERYRCTVILIAPRWPRKAWYPRLLEMSVQAPIMLPQRPDLLTQNRGRLQHPDPGQFCLAAWKLSADASLTRAFRQKSCRLYKPQSGTNHPWFMKDGGQNLWAGVVQGTLIPLQHL